MKQFLVLIFTILVSVFGNAQEFKSPNGNFTMKFSLLNDGTPTYQLYYLNKEVIKTSKLGLELKNDVKSLLNDFKVVSA
ncbi:MAG: hypothetical protein ACI9FW_002266, partial [Flavobacterium sp.]